MITLQTPSILIPFVDTIVCYFGSGMLVSMLEPHLSSAGATIYQVGLVFLVRGGVYMVTAFPAGMVRLYTLLCKYYFPDH